MCAHHYVEGRHSKNESQRELQLLHLVKFVSREPKTNYWVVAFHIVASGSQNLSDPVQSQQFRLEPPVEELKKLASLPQREHIAAPAQQHIAVP